MISEAPSIDKQAIDQPHYTPIDDVVVGKEMISLMCTACDYKCHLVGYLGDKIPCVYDNGIFPKWRKATKYDSEKACVICGGKIRDVDGSTTCSKRCTTIRDVLRRQYHNRSRVYGKLADTLFTCSVCGILAPMRESVGTCSVHCYISKNKDTVSVS